MVSTPLLNSSPAGRRRVTHSVTAQLSVRNGRSVNRACGSLCFSLISTGRAPPHGWGWVTLIRSPAARALFGSIVYFLVPELAFFFFFFFQRGSCVQPLSCYLSFPGGACDSPGCCVSGAIVYHQPPPRPEQPPGQHFTSRTRRAGRSNGALG